MTIQELIDELRTYPLDAQVFIYASYGHEKPEQVKVIPNRHFNDQTNCWEACAHISEQ